MKFRTILSRYFLLPTASLCSGRMHFKALHYKHFLEKTQLADRQTVEEFRNEQFRRLIRHCFLNVPYYRNCMHQNKLSVNDFQGVKDVVKLPILDKEVLNKNRHLLQATNTSKHTIRYETTGGTTGTPTQFGIDVKNYYRVHANAWRMWEYVGYVYGMKVMLFWGNRIELDRTTTMREKLKAIIENTKMLNFFDFSIEKLEDFAGCLNHFQPDIIRGFSGTIYLFVELCKKYHVNIQAKPKAIILTSENIFHAHKNKIAEFFNCDVFEEYGAREFGNMAHECPSHQGLHLAEELFIFEIFNPQLNTTSFEGNGEILVTSLYNYVMPLIRYRIEDEGTITSDYCSCGRNLRLLSTIDGRIADYVITKSERLIHQGVFNNLFYSSKGVLMYQVQQFEKGKAVIYIVKSTDFSEQTMSKLESDFKKMYKDDLTISFAYVDKISVSSSGKRRAVISHIAPQYLEILSPLP